MMKRLAAILLVIAIPLLLSAQNIWSNPITGSDPSDSNPYTTGDTYNNSLVSVSGIGFSSGLTKNAGAHRYNTKGWVVSNLDNGKYFYLWLSPTSGNYLHFTAFNFNYQSSSTGPTQYEVRVSTDNFATYSSISSGGLTNDGKAYPINISLPFADYGNVATAVEFRIYAWGGTGNTGTLSINDFEFKGAVDNTLPVNFGKVSAFFRDDQLLVHWNTLKEMNNSHFEVQASNDGKTFKTLKEIRANNNNADAAQSYQVSLPVKDLMTVVSISLLMGLLCFGRNRRGRLVCSLFLLIFVGVHFISCRKSADLKTSVKYQKLFIRIKQVDADGNYNYSRIVQATHE